MRMFICVLLAVFLVVGLQGCQATGGGRAKVLKRYEFSQGLMGTRFGIVLYCDDLETAIKAKDAAFARIQTLNSVCSDYDKESELRFFCRTAGNGQWMRLSNDLYRVLEYGQKLSERSGGSFDMTVGPMMKQWRRSSRKTFRLPSAKLMREVMAMTGYEKLELEVGSGVKGRLGVEGMLLDLGGIAKGSAADEAILVLKNFGIKRAMVDAGGDITVSGPPVGKAGWKIGVMDLDDQKGRHFVYLVNASIATSGDKFRYVKIGGVRYSHILDTKTGLGLRGRRSVSVVAHSGMAADALATAVSVMGREAGMEMLEKHYPEAAIYVLRKKEAGDGVVRFQSIGWPGVIENE